jgi:hypothetical protein
MINCSQGQQSTLPFFGNKRMYQMFHLLSVGHGTAFNSTRESGDEANFQLHYGDSVVCLLYMEDYLAVSAYYSILLLRDSKNDIQ